MIKNSLLLFLCTIGASTILWKFCVLWANLEREAKEKNKLIEYTGIIIAVASLIISILALGYTYSKSNDVDKRISDIENRLIQIESTTTN
jgi:hypothetical protein